MHQWVAIFSVLAVPAMAGGFKESVEIYCNVSKVDKAAMAGFNEGILEVFQPNVDHIQPKAKVSVVAGTDKRIIKIGESTFEKGDRSSLSFTRDTAGNYKLEMEHGDIEESFIITYNRARKTGTVTGYPSDADPTGLKPYAELDCK